MLATTEEGVPGARQCMRDLAGTDGKLLAPGPTRRLLLAAVDDNASQELVARVRAAGFPAVARPESGPQLDAWRRHTAPIEIGRRLSVCFVWSEHDRSDRLPTVELDPAGGFGSGSHPATQLILDGLARRIMGGESVLDIGCGSGVLALSAVRLGATKALGIDIEAPAIEATLRNAALNDLGHDVEAQLGPLDAVQDNFDVIVANVGRAAFVELASQVIPRLAPGGWLAVSGFSPRQCSHIAALMQPLHVVDRCTDGEWAALVLAR